MACARMIPVLLLLAGSGCAPIARLQAFRPAAHDLIGVERIAVVENDAVGAKSSDLRQSVVAALAENRSYTLVEPAVLEAAHPIRGTDGKTDRVATLDAAKMTGVDAVLTCAEFPGGQLRAELIDAATADVLAAPTAKDAHELTAQIAPSYVPVEVTLARQWWGEGKAGVAAGNALARQGDWVAAAEKWEEARKANPANHAALHNLALAAEARQNYREAFTLLDQALDQFPLKLYHQTRKRMEERQTTFLAAAKQVDAIRAAALAHATPPGMPNILPAAYSAPQALTPAAANQ